MLFELEEFYRRYLAYLLGVARTRCLRVIELLSRNREEIEVNSFQAIFQRPVINIVESTK